MKILWIENHKRFSEIAARRFLTGHCLTVVPSVAEAHQTLSAEQFDAVLLDYDLDDGKGIDLMPTIQGLRNPPVVIATSSHAEGNQKLIGAGADAVCSKMDFAKIENVLLQACKQRAI